MSVDERDAGTDAAGEVRTAASHPELAPAGSRSEVVGLAPVEGDPALDGSDCVGCGRCCHHPPRTVHLLESDDERLGPRRLEMYTELDPRPPGWRFLKNTGHRCGALDVSIPGHFPCGIYDARPEDCRIVEPGSPCCLEARRLGHLGESVDFLAPKST